MRTGQEFNKRANSILKKTETAQRIIEQRMAEAKEEESERVGGGADQTKGKSNCQKEGERSQTQIHREHIEATIFSLTEESRIRRRSEGPPLQAFEGRGFSTEEHLRGLGKGEEMGTELAEEAGRGGGTPKAPLEMERREPSDDKAPPADLQEKYCGLE
jgi:hypothetical protein